LEGRDQLVEYGRAYRAALVKYERSCSSLINQATLSQISERRPACHDIMGLKENYASRRIGLPKIQFLEYTNIVVNPIFLILCYTLRNPGYVSDFLSHVSGIPSR
jgi:hypothetical protein